MTWNPTENNVLPFLLGQCSPSKIFERDLSLD